MLDSKYCLWNTCYSIPGKIICIESYAKPNHVVCKGEDWGGQENVTHGRCIQALLHFLPLAHFTLDLVSSIFFTHTLNLEAQETSMFKLLPH